MPAKKETTAKKPTKKVSKSTPKAKPVKKITKKIEKKDTKLPESKQEIIDLFAQKNGDTGSPEVQVALLTYKIQRLTNHLESNKKDNHSRRGLLKVIAKRRRILNYLTKLDEARYKKLIKKLGLKK